MWDRVEELPKKLDPRKNFGKDPRKVLKYLIASRWKEEKRPKFSVPISILFAQDELDLRCGPRSRWDQVGRGDANSERQ